METVVFCKKYNEELPAMSFPPLPGQAGKDLMETVSQKAFDAWKLHQTTLINERRLDLSVQENRTFLIEEMHKFFENKKSHKPKVMLIQTKHSTMLYNRISLPL